MLTTPTPRTDQLSRHPGGTPGGPLGGRGRAQPAPGAPGGQARASRHDALQVLAGGVDDVDAAVRIVDPVDGHLVDAQAGALGEDEQLGVEEPPGVLDQRQQLRGDVRADRLEAALGVARTGRQRARAGSGCSSGR